MTACFCANITVLSITRATSKPFNQWKTVTAYTIRHDLSQGLEMRMARWLATSDFGNVGEIAEEENQLVCELPVSLGQDLLFETRMPFLIHKQYIMDMVQINDRTARNVCYEAITDVV